MILAGGGAGALGVRFEVRGIIGSGRLGTVYRAFDRSLEMEVALKVLRSDVFADDAARNRLLAGCTQAQRMQHPHLLRVLHADMRGSYPHYAMELAQGPTLRTALRERLTSRSPYGLAEAVQIIGRIAAALEVVHGGFPAHGLLRPENILVYPGEVKLADFHVASALRLGNIQDTDARELTPSYVAPEVLFGVPLSPASDVYSLAMIAVELLTGAAPSSSKLRLATARPELPVSVELLLSRCLDDDPMARPLSPAPLAEGLRAFLEDDGGFRARARTAASGDFPKPGYRSVGVDPAALPAATHPVIPAARGVTVTPVRSRAAPPRALEASALRAPALQASALRAPALQASALRAPALQVRAAVSGPPPLPRSAPEASALRAPALRAPATEIEVFVDSLPPHEPPESPIPHVAPVASAPVVRRHERRRRHRTLILVTAGAMSAAAVALVVYIVGFDPARPATVAVVTSPGARVRICEQSRCYRLGTVPASGTLETNYVTGQYRVLVEKAGCEPREFRARLAARERHTFDIGDLACAGGDSAPGNVGIRAALEPDGSVMIPAQQLP